MADRGLRRTLLVSPDMAMRVDEFRWAARMESEPEALRRLVEMGLAVWSAPKSDGRLVVETGGEGTPGATQNAVASYAPPSPDPRITVWVEEQEAARANRASLDDPALDPAASHLRLVNKPAYKAFDEAYRRLSPEDRAEMDRRLTVIWERFVAAGRTTLRGVTEEEIRRIAAGPAAGATDGGE